MNTKAITAALLLASIVCLITGSAIPPPVIEQPIVANLSVGNLDVFVFSLPGMFAYGSPLLDERVLVMPYSLRELDVAGQLVSVEDDWHNIPVLNDTIWFLGEKYTTDVNGVLASGLNMTTVLQNQAVLIVNVLLFEEDGLLSTRLDQFNITAGALKFDLEIRNWTFCDDEDEALGCWARGEILEVDIAIRALQDVVEQITNTTFYLGEDVLLLSNWEAEVDSEILRLEEGFPIVLYSNSTTIFPDNVPNNYTTNLLRLRFPRFEEYVLWDAIII